MMSKWRSIRRMVYWWNIMCMFVEAMEILRRDLINWPWLFNCFFSALMKQNNPLSLLLETSLCFTELSQLKAQTTYHCLPLWLRSSDLSCVGTPIVWIHSDLWVIGGKNVLCYILKQDIFCWTRVALAWVKPGFYKIFEFLGKKWWLFRYPFTFGWGGN